MSLLANSRTFLKSLGANADATSGTNAPSTHQSLSSTASPPSQGDAAFHSGVTTGPAIAGDIEQAIARKMAPVLQDAPAKTAVKALAKKPACRADVIEAFRRDELRPLWLGRYAYLWIADQPDRAKELKALKMDLVAAQLVTAATRLDYFICVYWIATALGWDEAQELRVAAIRELRRLFGRNEATGEWQIRKGLESSAAALWRRMVRDRLPAAAVRAQVTRLRPPRKAVKMTGPAAEVAKLFKSVKRAAMTYDDLQAMIRLCEDRISQLAPAAAESSRRAS